MNWTLEVVVVPVSNVSRAKAFYAERLGFNVDHDTQVERGESDRSTHPSRVRVLDRGR